MFIPKQHSAYKGKAGTKKHIEHRLSSWHRGYNTSWKKTRADHLQRNPLCEECLKQGVYTPASQVHHRKKLVDRPDLKHETDNLESICLPCHSRLTSLGL